MPSRAVTWLRKPGSFTFALVVFLFAINVYVCRELFRTEWLQHMGSIEGAYIGISRWAMSNWGDLSWFPLWYGGIPYQNSYPPFLHWLVAIAAGVLGNSPALAHHQVTALLYCAGPVGLFWMTLRLSGSRLGAFFAAAFYTALSPSAILIEAITNDLGGPLLPRRLQALVYYGEGPHISALTFLPMAIALVDLAIEKKRPWFTLAASLALVSVALTNWLAAFGLALAALCYVIARIDPKGWDVRFLARIAGMGALAYLIAMPWIPPSTIRVIQFNARTIEGDYTATYYALPKWILTGLLLMILLKLLFRRVRAPFGIQFAALFSLLTAGLTLTWAWGKVAIVPQPLRYHLEMEMALCMLAGLLVAAAVAQAPLWVQAGSAAILILLLAYPVKQARSYARNFLIRSIDIQSTSEYRMARWFETNMPGERVLAPGATSFFLNAFTSMPQIGGGFDQGTTNWMNRVAVYVIYTGEGTGSRDAEISAMWLKALGARAIGVSGRQSGEFYKPFRNPEKFEGVLEPLWRDGGDAVYRVPHRAPGLAYVIGTEDIVPRVPINGIDVEPMRRYLSALDDPKFPVAQFEWLDHRRMRIRAEIAEHQVISVQASYHRGWESENAGVRPDALGQIVLDPDCRGSCTFDLVYDGGKEMLWARLACAAMLLGFAAASVRAILKGNR